MWLTLDNPAVDLDGHVAAWLHDVAARRAHGHLAAGAMKLTSMLAEALLGPALDRLYLDRCALDVGPGNVALAWPDGEPQVRLTRSEVTEVPGDLDGWVAERAAASLGPVLEAVRRHSRVGLVTLWGRVADVVHARLLRAAKDLGHDTAEAWARAGRFVDALDLVTARLKLRPRPFPVSGSDRTGAPWEGTWLVFGTCCFLYRAGDHGTYCNVCPLREDRGRRFDWLQERPPAPRIGS